MESRDRPDPLLRGLERVENFQAGPPEVPFVSGHNGQIMPSRDRGNIAVLDRHQLAGPFKETRLVRPDVSGGHIETKDSPLHGLNASREPGLQSSPHPPFFRTNPVSNLGNHDTARV